MNTATAVADTALGIATLALVDRRSNLMHVVVAPWPECRIEQALHSYISSTRPSNLICDLGLEVYL